MCFLKWLLFTKAHKKMKHLQYSDASKTFPVCTWTATTKAQHGKTRFAALYLEEGLGAASWRIVPVGSRCHPPQRQQDEEAQPYWALSSTFPFHLCSLPSSFHFPSQEWLTKALAPYDGTTKPTWPAERAWMAPFVHDTNINVHKWRRKPDGFDVSLQLSRHLHNLKGRICHSVTALIPALSVILRQINSNANLIAQPHKDLL